MPIKATWGRDAHAVPPETTGILPTTLPELRACFVQQHPSVRGVDLAEELGTEQLSSAYYHRFFERLRTETLGILALEDGSAEIRPRVSGRWCEPLIAPRPIAMDDTLFLGLRAEVDNASVEKGIFVHRYIAWSKAQGRVAAQGGATITCEGLDSGEPVRIPDRWIYRMEVDYGDAWASVKILEFRRGMGLPSHLGARDLLEDDLAE